MELDKAVEKLVKFLNEGDSKSDEYAKAIRNLKEILELREKLNPKPQVIEIPEVKKGLTPEIVSLLGIAIPAIASLVGILIIIKHEELNVITSKALGFIMRSR